MDIGKSKLFGNSAIVLILAASAWSIPTAGAAQNPSGSADARASPPVEEVEVTATRVTRRGYDAPTPTIVLGAPDLLVANRPSIAEAVDDLPQFRSANTPVVSIGSTNSSAPVFDIRGLGNGNFEPSRTLTLLDGHRFVGANDLNTVPQGIIDRVDIVTGGASAAWGSGAVAGVVNIILNDKLEGLTVSANEGISARDDGERYGIDLTYGSYFADDRGHILFAADYFRDEGLFDRATRFGGILDSAEFTTSSGQIYLEKNVNYLNFAPGGVITSGSLAGMQFNPNGALSPITLGSLSNSTRTVGGNGVNSSDFEPISPPYYRANVYERTSYDVSNSLKISGSFSFTDVWADFLSQPGSVSGSNATFSKTNPFLTPAVQALLAPGPSTFTTGILFGDPEGYETLRYDRRTLEGSLKASGDFGSIWSYDAYIDYGELRQSQGFYNQAITTNFEQAINAVSVTAANVGSSGLPLGSIVCAVALTNPNTPCRPLNLFGVGNASQAAINYAFAQRDQVDLTNTTSLAAAGGSIHGDPFSTWAGPVSVAAGADVRREAVVTNNLDPLSASGALLNFDNSGTAGSYDVEEGFIEVVAPILNLADTLKVELNGAGRYSNYSTAGGNWAYKFGGTARLFNDFLLRTAYSQDVNAPNITELYTARSQANLSVIDPLQNNQSFAVVDYSGGNTALQPEVAHTFTIGGSYSPHFIPGLSASLDYYRVVIINAIATLSAQDIVTECALGDSVDCAQITRNSLGQITTINASYINIASYTTNGLDINVAYQTPLERLIPTVTGTLTLQSNTNYVPNLIINNGFQIYNYAGVVGDTVSFNVPHWRSIETMRYDNDRWGVDARFRYVGGGVFDSLTPIVNNEIEARKYIDLGAHLDIGSGVTIFANVQNLFDAAPPYVQRGSPFYDEMGRYFSLRVQAKL